MDFVFTDVFHLFAIVRRAQQHLPLTPSERSWLKAYKGILQALVLALVLAVYQFLAAHSSLAGINWQVELAGVGALLWQTYLTARTKFFTSQAPAEARTGQMLAKVAQGSNASPVPTPTPVPSPALIEKQPMAAGAIK